MFVMGLGGVDEDEGEDDNEDDNDNEEDESSGGVVCEEEQSLNELCVCLCGQL